ncbi:TIMELESS-interacting protein [Cydia fagiglandana]|uniref:TIMELESS-interacting protein n=1 Tax=Cydia fagiglandana TaxID=1458189 RepID=UPI002FEDE75F
MSLLEDVFLEDEAGEAQELERVIEGDELDDRPRSPDSNENSEKEDEAEEDKRVVDHTAKAKKAVKNPRFVLNPARLTGPRGIQILPEHFKDFKFKGKGHEREDLDLILKKLEHWAYRLYPKFKFDDCLKKIETLGKKRPVMVHLHKIRTDQFLSEETVQQQDSSGDEAAPPQEEDEFDRLLQQQIELARSTPAPGSARKEMHTPMSDHRSPLMLPKVTSSPSISDEQKERMIRNRRLAEERRLARLNQSNNSNQIANLSTETIPERTEETNTDNIAVNTGERTKLNTESDVTENNDEMDIETVVKKHYRTNVIDSDSSDDENILAVNESIVVDVHIPVVKDVANTDENNSDKQNLVEEALESDQIGISADVTTDNCDSMENNKEIETDVTEINSSNTMNTKDKSNSEITEVVSDNIIVKENDIPPSIINEPENGEKDGDLFRGELMDVDFTDDF